jgi:glucose dehydrogenase
MGASLEFIEDGQEIDRAFNVKSGEEVWRDARPNEGFAGGMLTTAGNLVFYGSADGHLNAVNATTGEKLWSYRAGITFKSAPITYELDGRQYVAQLAGGLQLGKAWEWLQTAPDGGMLFVFSR